MKLLVSCLAIVLSACAGTEAGVSGLAHSDALTVQRSPSADYDYLITIKKVQGMGYDPADQTARDRAALSAIKDQCEAPQIVKETVVDGGAFVLGDSARRYEIRIRC